MDHCNICYGTRDLNKSFSLYQLCKKCDNLGLYRIAEIITGSSTIYTWTDLSGNRWTKNNWRYHEPTSDRLAEVARERNECIICRATPLTRRADIGGCPPLSKDMLICDECFGVNGNGVPNFILKIAAGVTRRYIDGTITYDSSNWYGQNDAFKRLVQADMRIKNEIVIPKPGAWNLTPEVPPQPVCNLCKGYSLMGGFCMRGHSKASKDCFEQA